MKSERPLLIAVLLSALPLPIQGQSTNNPPPFSAVYAFGDCLTDTHNVAGVPFYSWQNRTANGPMWIEYISTNLGLVYRADRNYAVSASTTSNVLGRIINFPRSNNASNALFVVWAGPVDFYWHLGEGIWGVPFASPTNDVVWNSVIAQGVNNLSNAVANLYAKGGRSFLVPNVDDVSRQPVVITWDNEETRSGVRQRVQQFNSALAHALASIDQAHPDLRIVNPDAFGLFSDFIDNPPKYGMTISYPAAMQDDGLTDQSFTGPGADYVFWDQFGHPTTKGHSFIAADFMNALTNARPEKLSVVTTSNSARLTLGKLLIGRTYTVQKSSNLATWQDVYPFTATAGTNQWLDVASGAAAQFYRLVWAQ
jgi:phospholipase/lecithinase/hemolysin